MTWEGRLTFEVSSAAPDSATPVWVDLTSRVRDEVELLRWGRGRSTNLEGSDPGTFSALLDNRDDALTIGNTASPYTSWWGPGRKFRLREHIGQSTLDQCTGYLEIPEETLETAELEAWVSLTAVDRLGRFAKAQPFISTLAAHIMGSIRDNRLYGYWPLLDAGRRAVPAVGTIALALRIDGNLALSLATDHAAEVEPQGGPTLPGDDVPTLRLASGLFNGSPASSPYMSASFPTTFAMSAGWTMTAAMWLNPASDALLQSPLSAFIQANGSGSGQVSVTRVDFATGNRWRASVNMGAITGTIDTPDGVANSYDRWTQLAVRLGFSPDVFELWVDGVVYTGTFSASPTGLAPYGMLIGGWGANAHAQMYIGPSADFTIADAALQRTVALTGLDRQPTGERIRTVLQYAGMASTELSRIDAGTAVMSPARLAGLDPYSAARQAETTEQGLLWVDGNGEVVFSDRRRLYNI